MAVNPRCAKCHWQHTPGQSIDYCIMCIRERPHEHGFVGMTEHETKLARSPALVEVTQDQYNAYLDTIKHLETFSEGHDVGRTHGIGAIYLGSRLVAQWRWLFDDDRKRVWTYEILSTEVPHVPEPDLSEREAFIRDSKASGHDCAEKADGTFQNIYLEAAWSGWQQRAQYDKESINRNEAEGQ